MLALGTTAAGVVIGAQIVLMTRLRISLAGFGFAVAQTGLMGAVVWGLGGRASLPAFGLGEAVGILALSLLIGAHRAHAGAGSAVVAD